MIQLEQIIFAWIEVEWNNSYANYVSTCFSVSATGLTSLHKDLHKLQFGSNS